MQKKFVFFDKKFDISQSYVRLLLTIFAVAILAKGVVIFRGFAIDDYLFSSGVSSVTLDLCISQGRYIMAAIIWIIDSLGANINDLYFPFGIMTLLLYSAFVVSILRFVGMDNLPAAGLVGAIMIAHPYLTEIFTFRMALPTVSSALIFSIIALEMVIRNPVTWATRAGALLATFAMLFTYQIFLNYFAVAIIFAFIYGQLFHNKKGQLLTTNVYRERAITLTIISTIAAVTSVVIIWLCKTLGLSYAQNRAGIMNIDMIPERINQMSSALVNIYWSTEPIFSGWLKTLVALMLIVSVIIIFWRLFTEKDNENYKTTMIVTFLGLLLLIPASLGLIIVTPDWWVVPRVVSHVAIIIGLIFLMTDIFIQDLDNPLLKLTIFVSKIVVLIGFILLSNQILADQQRLNQWDKMMANRIVSRLEMQPDFNNIQFVHVNGGSWQYPAKLRTPQGDMNVSALSVPYAKAALLSEVSGYNFQWAIGSKAVAGEAYCEGKQFWPHSESVTIDNDLAIICLKK